MAGLISSAHEILRDRRLQTQRITADLIGYVVKKIVQEVAPERVILFGAHARGEAGQNSDLDLFVIQDGHASNRAVRRQIEAALRGRRFGVDLIVRTTAEVRRNLADGHPFYRRDIFGEGRVLYERSTQTPR